MQSQMQMKSDKPLTAEEIEKIAREFYIKEKGPDIFITAVEIHFINDGFSVKKVAEYYKGTFPSQ